MNQESRLILLGLVLVALVLRLVFAGVIVGWHKAPIGDEIDYIDLATSLADGEGYKVRGNETTARRPFMYPATLAVMFKVTGPSPAAARVMQVLLGAVIVWMVFAVARRYFEDEKVAWIATVLTAFNPFLIFISGYILTENTYIAVLLGLLLVAPKPDDLTSSLKVAIATAVVVGVGCLARPTALGVTLWMLAALWLFGSAFPAQEAARDGRGRRHPAANTAAVGGAQQRGVR